MTDAERTSVQAEEQEQTKTNGGLFNKIVETARNVVGTVTETAKDVVGTGGERGPETASPATAASGMAASAVADQPRDPGGDAPAGQALTTAIAEGGPAVAETRPVAVVEDGQPEAGTEAPATVQEIAEAVRRRVSRVYGAVTGATPTAEQQPAPGAEQNQDAAPSTEGAPAEGATYQPAPEGGAKSGRPRRFKDVQAGMQLKGKVTSIALYGIFVDVGVGRDGLVHISEMSDQRVDSPTDLVQIGSEVDVWVKSVDPDARRISLTMRDPNRPKPERQERRGPRRREVNRERLAEMKAGDTVEGVISSLAPFGAFVDIGVGKDGLVHVSELAEGRVERPEDAVQVGERYTFKILEVDPEGNRISLSLRRAMRNQRMQQLEPGTIMDGTISGIAPFGAFVDVGVGRDGLVHVSELSPERVNQVEDIVKVGDKVQVKVIEVDPNSKRTSLTMRVDEPLPNERERTAPRAAGPAPTGDRAPAYTPRPSFPPAPPAFGDLPAPDGGRGGDRGGARRGTRDFDRPAFDRGDDRNAGSRRPSRDRNDQQRSGAGRRPGGRSEGGRRREGEAYEPSQEVYTFEDPDEETFTGDATLEDLVSKFNAGKGRDRRQTRDDDDEDGGGRNRGNRDAISRTLAMRDEE
jgi:predicted RNA-binding protein with RPS1 domain